MCDVVLCDLELVLFGVGYHHAGLDIADRKAIETMFTAGDLPVLCKYSPNPIGLSAHGYLYPLFCTCPCVTMTYPVATSTLAMGVSC